MKKLVRFLIWSLWDHLSWFERIVMLAVPVGGVGGGISISWATGGVIAAALLAFLWAKAAWEYYSTLSPTIEIGEISDGTTEQKFVVESFVRVTNSSLQDISQALARFEFIQNEYRREIESYINLRTRHGLGDPKSGRFGLDCGQFKDVLLVKFHNLPGIAKKIEVLNSDGKTISLKPGTYFSKLRITGAGEPAECNLRIYQDSNSSECGVYKVEGID